MESSVINKNQARKKRAIRVRKRVRGCCDMPRLCVVKTNANIQVQIIDDEKGITLASTSTFSKDFRDTEYARKNKASAQQLGKKIAQMAKEKNVNKVVFDRGRSKYHGVIAALADAAREAGLEF